MIHVVHLITGLETGGAEMMLARLVGAMDPGRFRNRVVSMLPAGAAGQELRLRGVEVQDLAMVRGRPSPGALWRLIRLLRRQPPDVLQTWLYHADLLGLLAGTLAGTRHVVWNLRSSELSMRRYGKWSSRTRWLLARLSPFPTLVLSNSEAGRRDHEALGYRPRRWEVIPNGFDTGRFRPDSNARDRLRRELGLSRESSLVGLVARFDPKKDHATFLRAAARVFRRGVDVHFVLAGRGVEIGNADLAEHLVERDFAARVHLLGERRDVPAILAALDVAALTSDEGEGFPNVLGEAMACGVPCVSTDCGDAAAIVGETGIVVPVGDPDALARAWERLLLMPSPARRRLGMAARRRVVSEYSLAAIAARYEQLYEELCRA